MGHFIKLRFLELFIVTNLSVLAWLSYEKENWCYILGGLSGVCLGRGLGRWQNERDEAR